MNPLVIKNITKSYGGVKAVDNVSFEIEKGEIFGLIGPDGSGKTTILRCVVSLMSPDDGTIFFMDKDVQENTMFVRSNIGYMPQRFSLYQDLSVEQNLRFFGDLFKISRSDQNEQMEKLYKFSKLSSFKNRRAGNLSGGMKQKLALSCMLMHQPGVVVLDEPTFGVDPVSRSEFWEILHTLSQNGISILVTTAYMEEAGQCHRVGLIFSGNILAMDKPNNLVKNFNHPVYLLKTDFPHKTFAMLKDSAYSKDIQLFGEGIHILDRSQMGHKKIEDDLSKLSIDNSKLQPISPGLENLFLTLMHK